MFSTTEFHTRAKVGPSHNWIVEDMFGLPYERPARLVRDYVEVLNAAFAGPAPVDVENDSYRVHNPIDEVNIGVVGKYVELEDAYKSLREALIHGGLVHNLRTKIHWIEAESLEDGGEPSKLRQFDGILVPGGFGKRGIPGMIRAIQYARQQKVPSGFQR